MTTPLKCNTRFTAKKEIQEDEIDALYKIFTYTMQKTHYG